MERLKIRGNWVIQNFDEGDNITYRPRAECLVYVVDVVIDVIVVEMIAGIGIGGVVVARVMIRVIPIVVLVMLVQHHCGEHVECLPVNTRNERGWSFGKARLTAPRFAASLESFTSDPTKISRLQFTAIME